MTRIYNLNKKNLFYVLAKDDDKFQSTVPGEEGVTCDFTIYQEGSEVISHC